MKLNGWLPALLLASIVLIAGYFYFSKKQSAAQPKTILSFMGAPGSGKGTLAEKCIKDLKYKSLSTGNLLREAVAQETELGKKADIYMKEGKLVPDELVTSIVEEWLNKNLPHIRTLILDGFPRTAHQAELFLDLLRTKFNNISFRVVDLVISDETIVKRLADRLVCEKCQAPYSQQLLKDPQKLICEICGGKLIQRKDDKEEVVRNRLKVYAEHAKPLLDVYEASGIKIDQINAEGKTPQQVFDEFKERLKDKPTSMAQPKAA